MTAPLGRVAITSTPPGATHRDIATAVIADKLGISPESISDNTELGDSYREISMTIAYKTGEIVFSSSGMTAKDIFDQL